MIMPDTISRCEVNKAREGFKSSSTASTVMFHSAEEETGIYLEQDIRRSGKENDVSLCKFGDVSCIRCCLPHIGGDSHTEDPGEIRASVSRKCGSVCRVTCADRYLGPGNILMKFRNFNPLNDPRIEASQYEDSFPDVGKEEMETRFSGRRNLFLEIYDHNQPRRSLPRYMKAAWEKEGYKYRPAASAGLSSLYLGGSVPAGPIQKGELPECQLLGFVDAKRTAGCMAHPLAETSQGWDGRDQVGFFHHTGCCSRIGCEASYEFKYLSPSAVKVFAEAVKGMSWYEYSRHATSVLVYYLRSYDPILRNLDDLDLLDTLTLEQTVAFTNSIYDEWPLKKPVRSLRLIKSSASMNSLDILSTSIPLAERIMYIALDTWFLPGCFAEQLQQARAHLDGKVENLRRA